jgi:hypothetical protein
MTPTIGRIVHYTLSESDAAAINKRRDDYRKAVKGGAVAFMDEPGWQAHVGNMAAAGDVYPAMIVRTWGSTPESAVQLQVFLDGNDTYWATSRAVGDKPGTYAWPVVGGAK